MRGLHDGPVRIRNADRVHGAQVGGAAAVSNGDGIRWNDSWGTYENGR
jgi:hypothetical protein